MKKLKYKIAAQTRIKTYASAIAAKLVAKLVSIDADNFTLQVAMEEFAPTIQCQMLTLLNDMEVDPAYQVYDEDDIDAPRTVSLDGLADPTKKINVIRAVREITLLGLRDAKNLVEGAPQRVKECGSAKEASEVKRMLEAAGGRVCIK